MLLANLNIGPARLAVLDLSVASFEQCCPLADIEQKELDTLSNPSRIKERWGSFYLLRHIMGIQSPLTHAPSGAPVLLDSTQRISISHSNDAVAILVHPHANVGVDIERKTRDFTLAASRILSLPEQDFVQGNHQLQGLAWCAKEALYKIAGYEGLDFARHIQLLPFTALPGASITAHLHVPGRQQAQLTLHTLPLPRHYLVYGWV